MNRNALHFIDLPLLGQPNIQLAALNVETLNVESWLSETSPISPQRRKHVLRFIKREDRQRSMGATLLLDHLLSNHQLHEKDMIYTENKEHKPLLMNHPHLHFNMSHSGAYALCALAPFAVGVDIQEKVQYQENLAQLCTSPQERELLKTVSPEWRDETFTQLWCLKEAVLKANGTGITDEPLPAFGLLQGQLRLQDKRYANWTTHLLNLENYSLAIAHQKDLNF